MREITASSSSAIEKVVATIPVRPEAVSRGQGGSTGRLEDVETMLTVAEVAGWLRVHVNTVRRWNNRGRLKAYRIGSRGDRRFRREDVISFLSRKNGDGD